MYREDISNELQEKTQEIKGGHHDEEDTKTGRMRAQNGEKGSSG